MDYENISYLYDRKSNIKNTIMNRESFVKDSSVNDFIQWLSIKLDAGLYILIQIEEHKKFGIVFLYMMRIRSISGVERAFKRMQKHWISYLLT